MRFVLRFIDWILGLLGFEREKCYICHGPVGEDYSPVMLENVEGIEEPFVFAKICAVCADGLDNKAQIEEIQHGGE
jgi:hypothetical protein